jgi:3-oxoacyl-[acyl-carrier protein] reductase
MDLGIEGRVAVVTGGDSGIGFAAAKMLLDAGARVVLSDKAEGPLKDAARQLLQIGDVLPVAGDLTRPADVTRLYKSAKERFGKTDILINCAGVTGATGLFHEIDDDGWHKTLETDLMIAVRLVRAFVGDMRSKRWGRIVLIGSEDAVQPYVDELPYCAAKAAVLNLAKGLSKTYAREGVLVNAVSPAYIHTPMTDAMMEKRAKKLGVSFDEAVKSFLKEERPHLELRRRGEPEEVAAAIVFLCSERASFINGANLRVDGGSVATV